MQSGSDSKSTVSPTQANILRWVYKPLIMTAPMFAVPWVEPTTPFFASLHAFVESMGPIAGPLFVTSILNRKLGKFFEFFGFYDVNASCQVYGDINSPAVLASESWNQNIRTGLAVKAMEEVASAVIPALGTVLAYGVYRGTGATFADEGDWPRIVFGYAGHAIAEVSDMVVKRFEIFPMHPNKKMNFDALGMSKDLKAHEWLLKGLLRQADYFVVNISLYAVLQRAIQTENYWFCLTMLGVFYGNNFGRYLLTTPEPCGQGVLAEGPPAANADTRFVLLDENDPESGTTPAAALRESQISQKKCHMSTVGLVQMMLSGTIMVACGSVAAVVDFNGDKSDREKSTGEKATTVVAGFAKVSVAAYGVTKGMALLVPAGYELLNRTYTWCTMWGKKEDNNDNTNVNGLGTGFSDAINGNKSRPLASTDELTKHQMKTPATARGSDRSNARANNNKTIRL